LEGHGVLLSSGFAARSLPAAAQAVSPFLAQQSEMGVTQVGRCCWATSRLQPLTAKWLKAELEL
jgi:hypothetical protein